MKIKKTMKTMIGKLVVVNGKSYGLIDGVYDLFGISKYGFLEGSKGYRRECLVSPDSVKEVTNENDIKRAFKSALSYFRNEIRALKQHIDFVNRMEDWTDEQKNNHITVAQDKLAKCMEWRARLLNI